MLFLRWFIAGPFVVRLTRCYLITLVCRSQLPFALHTRAGRAFTAALFIAFASPHAHAPHHTAHYRARGDELPAVDAPTHRSYHTHAPPTTLPPACTLQFCYLPPPPPRHRTLPALYAFLLVENGRTFRGRFLPLDVLVDHALHWCQPDGRLGRWDGWWQAVGGAWRVPLPACCTWLVPWSILGILCAQC